MEALDEAPRQLLIQVSKRKKESVAAGGLFMQGMTAEFVFCVLPESHSWGSASGL